MWEPLRFEKPSWLVLEQWVAARRPRSSVEAVRVRGLVDYVKCFELGESPWRQRRGSRFDATGCGEYDANAKSAVVNLSSFVSFL